MSQEQAPRPSGLSLEAVAELAQETLLKDGAHLPTVIAEGSAQTVVTQLPDLGRSHDERFHKLFLAGVQIARQAPVGVLHQAFFICEAWMSVGKPGQLPAQPPSQDPQRKEVLVVAGLEMQAARVQVRIFEMVRETDGRLVELKAFEPGGGETPHSESPLLAAFALGYAAGGGEPTH
jgi:hypothetical protein